MRRDKRTFSGLFAALHPELAQVMIEVLVHQSGPLLRRELAEEGVRMLGTARRPGGGEPFYQRTKACLFLREVAFVPYHEGFCGACIAAQGFIVGKHPGLDEGSQYPSDEHSRGNGVANGPFHCHRAVRQGLPWIHFAPLPRAVWSELCDPFFHFLHCRRFIKVFHSESLPMTNFRNWFASAKYLDAVPCDLLQGNPRQSIGEGHHHCKQVEVVIYARL
jgi:hypothetical protein